jgi:hypothetical protein
MWLDLDEMDEKNELETLGKEKMPRTLGTS